MTTWHIRRSATAARRRCASWCIVYPERSRKYSCDFGRLNADAINEQLRTLLPMLRTLLTENAGHVGEIDIVVQNGRVRVGYEIGGLVGATVVVHLIGERPGTGLNTLSAYITYGRDEAGAWRWSRALDHSATTAICGIHAKGKPPQVRSDGNRSHGPSHAAQRRPASR
jgi:hypothetical protein